MNIFKIAFIFLLAFFLGAMATSVILVSHYEKKGYLSAMRKVWKDFFSIFREEPREEAFPLLIGYDSFVKQFDYTAINNFFQPVATLFTAFYCKGVRMREGWHVVSYCFAVTIPPNAPPHDELEDTAEQLATATIGKYLTDIGRSDLNENFLVAAELKQTGLLWIHIALTQNGAGQISQFKQQRQQHRAMAAQKKNMTTQWPGGGTP